MTPMHHQHIISASSPYHQCIISAPSAHHQCITSASSGCHQHIIPTREHRPETVFRKFLDVATALIWQWPIIFTFLPQSNTTINQYINCLLQGLKAQSYSLFQNSDPEFCIIYCVQFFHGSSSNHQDLSEHKVINITLSIKPSEIHCGQPAWLGAKTAVSLVT